MVQYGKGWWVMLSALVGVLAVLVLTTTTRSESASGLSSSPVAEVDCCSGPFRLSGWDLPSLRRELAAFSDDESTVTFLDRTDTAPFEVRVRTDEQAAFVRRILGPDPRWFDVIVDDPGTAIPDPPPVSVHLLTVEEMLAARDTLLRIIQNEGGGGHVVRGPRPCRTWSGQDEFGCSLDPGFVSSTPGILVSFENDEYLEMARRLFGPDVPYVEWELAEGLTGTASGITSITPAGHGQPVSRWNAATIAGVIFIVAVGVLVALVPYDFIAKRRFPTITWALVGAGLVVMWLVGAADLLGYGYPGFGRVQVIGVSVAVFLVLPAAYYLARASFPGWRQAVSYGLLLALAVASASHVLALRNRPAHTVVGHVTIADRVSVLAEPGPEELADALRADIDLIQSQGLAYSARFSPAEKAVAATVDADIQRASYPVEMELRFSGDDPLETRTAAEGVLGHYALSRLEDPLREPRGAASMSIADPYATDYYPFSVLGSYTLGALLLLMIIPWPWWQSTSKNPTGSPASASNTASAHTHTPDHPVLDP